MEKEQWIDDKIAKLKQDAEKYPKDIKISDCHLNWIRDMFDSAWERGASEGRNEAYNNVKKWRKESDETISS